MKRLVVRHRDGMHQIIGHAPTGVQLPITLPLDGNTMSLLGREIKLLSLVQVEPRYALYLEPLEPNYES